MKGKAGNSCKMRRVGDLHEKEAGKYMQNQESWRFA